ncbi:MAG: hypothetical protein Ta2D_00020 [Rickettsiales bacterium]|nr:MAG: hypothetical protein Ta2D_00020 [Rickettsiales bacterium]
MSDKDNFFTNKIDKNFEKDSIKYTNLTKQLEYLKDKTAKQKAEAITNALNELVGSETKTKDNKTIGVKEKEHITTEHIKNKMNTINNKGEKRRNIASLQNLKKVIQQAIFNSESEVDLTHNKDKQLLDFKKNEVNKFLKFDSVIKIRNDFFNVILTTAKLNNEVNNDKSYLYEINTEKDISNGFIEKLGDASSNQSITKKNNMSNNLLNNEIDTKKTSLMGSYMSLGDASNNQSITQKNKISNYNIVELDEVDSTMLKIKEYEVNTILVAQKQTNGRGKDNRVWNSEKNGNLYFSMLLNAEKQLNYSQLSFVVSLAFRDAIPNSISKWPNDILLNDKKCCGILLQLDNKKLIIGCGLNIKTYPPNTSFPATSLKDEGFIIDRIEILKVFLQNFNNYYEIWEKNGFSIIREKWLEKCYNLKKKIKINEKEGIFFDIDNEGALLLSIGDKIEKITSGDVGLII